MKKTLLAILNLFIAIQISAQVDGNQYTQFHKDSTYFLIGDQVNIRSKPDTNGTIIDHLKIGEKVTIIKALPDHTYISRGYESPWYEVKYTNNNGENKKGYVWGGMIASGAIQGINNKDLFLFFAPSKMVNKEFNSDLFLQIRLCKNNIQLAKLEIEAVGSLQTYLETESAGKKGVDGLKEIFEIHFSAGYCGGANGTAFFFWDGNTLFHPLTLNEGFDAPYFWRNDLIFPTDSLGKKGYIINKSESGYYGDDDKTHIEEWEKITYTWNGKELVVTKKEKKK